MHENGPLSILLWNFYDALSFQIFSTIVHLMKDEIAICNNVLFSFSAFICIKTYIQNAIPFMFRIIDCYIFFVAIALEPLSFSASRFRFLFLHKFMTFIFQFNFINYFAAEKCQRYRIFMFKNAIKIYIAKQR